MWLPTSRYSTMFNPSLAEMWLHTSTDTNNVYSQDCWSESFKPIKSLDHQDVLRVNLLNQKQLDHQMMSWNLNQCFDINMSRVNLLYTIQIIYIHSTSNCDSQKHQCTKNFTLRVYKKKLDHQVMSINLNVNSQNLQKWLSPPNHCYWYFRLLLILILLHLK